MLQRLFGPLQRPEGMLKRLFQMLQRPAERLQRLLGLLQRLFHALQRLKGPLQRLFASLQPWQRGRRALQGARWLMRNHLRTLQRVLRTHARHVRR